MSCRYLEFDLEYNQRVVLDTAKAKQVRVEQGGGEGGGYGVAQHNTGNQKLATKNNPCTSVRTAAHAFVYFNHDTKII